MSSIRFRYALAWLLVKGLLDEADALIAWYAALPLPDYSLSDSERTELPEWCK